MITKISFDKLLKNNKITDKNLWIGLLTSEFTLALFFVSMVIPPFGIYMGTKFRYVGIFSPNPYQNATFIAARPFAIASFVLFLNLVEEYENNYKGKVWDYIIFSLMFLLSTMTKPSFTLVLGASAVVVILVRFVKAKFKTVKQSIFLGLLFLPTIIDLLYQFKGVFMATGGGEGGVGFTLGGIWLQYTNNIVSSILLAIAFPLFVLLLNAKRMITDHRFRFAWLFYIISFIMAFFCYEKGRRAVDFNFSWSYMYGIFFVFFESVIVTIEDLKDKNKKRNIFGLLEMCAFLVHLVSGMGYFANMFAGNSYY